MKKQTLSLLSIALLSASLHAEFVTSYFDKGGKKAETHYKDGTRSDTSEGIKHGIEKVYYQEGMLAYVVNYIDGKRDGKLTWYDKEGKLLAMMNYKMGKLEGEEKTYFSNGQIKHTVTYVNDQKEGLQKEYFSNGTLAMETPYVHNKKQGIQKEYNNDGKLYSQVKYVNNYKEGNQEWYDKDGKVIRTQYFKMDRPINLMKELKNDYIKEKEEQDIIIKGLNFSPNRPHD